MKRPFLLLLFITISVSSFSQSPNLVFENAHISRTFNIENGFYTRSFISKSLQYDYSRPGGIELSFEIDGTLYHSGENGNLNYQSHEVEKSEKSSVLKVTLSTNHSVANFEVIANYQLFKDHEAVRKWITIRNIGGSTIELRDLFVENITMDPWGGAGVKVFGQYGQNETFLPFIGSENDPAVFVSGQKASYILGNEAPGILKCIKIWKDYNNQVAIGLNPKEHDYAFAYRLKPGESFKSPAAFIVLTGQKDPQKGYETSLSPFVLDVLPIKYNQLTEKPSLLYNTWHPFLLDINEKMIKDITDSLAGTGADYVIIDDGWMDYYGDWNVNKEKFPNGLAPVFKHIRERGMKPGLWISLATVDKDSKAFQKYSRYAVKNKEGVASNLHGWVNDFDVYTMDILSPYYDYIQEKIFDIVAKHDLKYLKIDLALIKSAYVLNPDISGNYDTTDVYCGREDYMYKAYMKMFELFDLLSDRFPELIIDCTYELYGHNHIVDYALMKHAHVDWISNFTVLPPEGSRDARKLLYQNGALVPPTVMVIGNQQIDVPNHELSFISLLPSSIVLLGDPRNLMPEVKNWYKKHVEWYDKMNSTYQIENLLQTSSFDEPRENNWDGYAQFNAATNGGIVIIFRNDSPEKRRIFQFNFVAPESVYSIYNVEGKSLYQSVSGSEMIENGINIETPEKNSFVVMEIEPVE